MIFVLRNNGLRTRFQVSSSLAITLGPDQVAKTVDPTIVKFFKHQPMVTVTQRARLNGEETTVGADPTREETSEVVYPGKPEPNPSSETGPDLNPEEGKEDEEDQEEKPDSDDEGVEGQETSEDEGEGAEG